MRTNNLRNVVSVAMGGAGIAGLTAVCAPVDLACWTVHAVGRGLCWVSRKLKAARASLASGVEASAHELAEAAGDLVYGPVNPTPYAATADVPLANPEPISEPEPVAEPESVPEPESVVLPLEAPRIAQDEPKPEIAPSAAQTTKARRKPAHRRSEASAEPKPPVNPVQTDRDERCRRAAALVAEGKSRRAAAAEVGVSESTLRGWLKRQS